VASQIPARPLLQDPPAALIEFAGLPGSGKSSFSHVLAEALARRGLPVSEPSFEITHRRGPGARRRAKLGYVAAALGRRPRQGLCALDVVRSAGAASLADTARVAWNLLAVQGMAGPSGEVRVLDQGPIQGLWSVAFSASSALDPGAAARWLEPIARDWPAWWIVFVEVPEELALARLAERGPRQSRLEDPTRRDPIANARRALDECRRAAERLERNAPETVQVLRVASRNEAERDREVARLLERLGAPAGSER
jgi:thymidylate kinase